MSGSAFSKENISLDDLPWLISIYCIVLEKTILFLLICITIVPFFAISHRCTSKLLPE